MPFLCAAAAADEQPDDGSVVIHFHEGSAAHVTLHRGGDGVVTLEGAGLWNIRCAPRLSGRLWACC